MNRKCFHSRMDSGLTWFFVSWTDPDFNKIRKFHQVLKREFAEIPGMYPAIYDGKEHVDPIDPDYVGTMLLFETYTFPETIRGAFKYFCEKWVPIETQFWGE